MLPIILPKDFKGYASENISESDYFGATDFVNSSLLKLIMQSPLHFIHEVKNRQTFGVVSPAMRFGKAAHAFILEPEKFQSKLSILPEVENYRTKAAREERDAFLASVPVGNVVLKKDEYTDFMEGVTGLVEHKIISNLLADKNSRMELSGYFRERVTGMGTKVRWDYINVERGTIFDLKTCQDCRMEEFQKTIFNFKYYFQLALQKRAAEEIFSKEFKICGYIAMESSAPFASAVYTLDDGALDYAYCELDSAFEKLSSCLESGIWPGPQLEAENISLPSWAFNKII